MKGFDEAWLADYEARNRQAAPGPVKRLSVQSLAATEPKPSPAVIVPSRRPDIVIRLIAPTPLMNKWERMHWTKKRDCKHEMSAEVFAYLGGLVLPAPIRFAEVKVWRHSTREPDPDGLIVKHILDVLQPKSSRHPYGLGYIEDDDSKHLICHRHHMQCQRYADQHTLIRVRDLGPDGVPPVAMPAAA